MNSGSNLEELLIDFASKIISTSRQISKTTEGQHIAKQILRSGMSPAALYAEAQSYAKGSDNAIRNLTVALKALNVTKVWLKIIARSELLSKEVLKPLFIECEELHKILQSTINRNMTSSEEHILSFFGEVFEDKGESSPSLS